jgi:Fic family protein
MAQLVLPRPEYAGAFRGQPGLEGVEVGVGPHRGVASASVVLELAEFEVRLQRAVAALDERIAAGAEPTQQEIDAVIALMAWAHAEWIRIHPFANGNGRTARIWANSIAMRYGLPPFVRLRPRPDVGYGAAGEAAMRGIWNDTTAVLRKLFERFLSDETARAARSGPD